MTRWADLELRSVRKDGMLLLQRGTDYDRPISWAAYHPGNGPRVSINGRSIWWRTRAAAKAYIDKHYPLGAS